MANYPMNIWVINEDEFDEFTFTGGKVIYIVEEPDPRFATHPAIVTAGALLPPTEAITAELDGNMFQSVAIYEEYLQREEANPFVSIIIAAGLKQIPIGIMFGKEEMNNLQFPKMFIDFMYRFYGLVFGIKDKVRPYIIEHMMPIILSKLYMMNIIDYPTFMEKHPPLAIDPNVISKMAYEVHPAVEVKDMPHYIEYFEGIRDAVYKNGGKFLIDPLEAVW